MFQRSNTSKRYKRLAHQQRGVALVIVMWIVSMMMLIAGSLMYSVKTEMNLAQLAQRSAQSRAYADAALRYTVAQLQLPKRLRAIQIGGQANSWQFENVDIELRVLGEAGLIDINSASRNLLNKILEQVGIVDQEAQALLDKIEDFRDEDDLKRLNGAEDNDYADAGFEFGAKDAKFERIEELQQVMDISLSLYKRLAHYLTVNSNSKGVNPMYAPRRILLLLADGEVELVNRYMQLREESEGGWLQPSFGGTYIDRTQQPAYRIHIKVKLEEGQPAYEEERSIRLVPGKLPPFISYYRKLQSSGKDFGH